MDVTLKYRERLDSVKAWTRSPKTYVYLKHQTTGVWLSGRHPRCLMTTPHVIDYFLCFCHSVPGWHSHCSRTTFPMFQDDTLEWYHTISNRSRCQPWNNSSWNIWNVAINMTKWGNQVSSLNNGIWNSNFDS